MKASLNLCGDAAKAVAGGIANPVVEAVDVDGVVRRIDLNKALERIDFNNVLDRIDLDRHLNRVDFNRILRRVDVNELIARSDLSAIIAQSTTGVFGSVLDTLRSQLVLVDLVTFRIARFNWKLGGSTTLPPKPSLSVGSGSSAVEQQPEATDDRGEPVVRPKYPRGRMAKSVAVQGRYCGFFSKAVAIFIDVGLVTVIVAVLLIIIQLCLILFQGTSKEDAKDAVDRSSFWFLPFYGVFWWLYFFMGVALVGQTVGMSICGIKVVPSKRGSELSAWQVIIRTSLLPVSLTLMPFLGAIGFFRRDGRMLHDLFASTGLVYKWDARMAALREKADEEFEEQQEDADTSSAATSLLSGPSQRVYESSIS